MASAKLMQTKDNRKYYKISVSRGHGVTPYTTQWYVPDGVSNRTIKRELDRFVAEFELKCSKGEVRTRQELKAEADAKRKEEAKIKTIKQFGEEIFIPSKKAEKAIGTVEFYQYILDGHIYPTFADYRIDEVSVSDVKKFFIKLGTTDKPLSYSTIRGIYNTLHGLFELATTMELINRNPCNKSIKPKRSKDDVSTEVESFSIDELKYILECLKHEPLKWRAYVNLLIESGMRRGEACGLTWDDIDFIHKEISINKTLSHGKDGVRTASTKSGKTRIVSVSANMIKLLEELRNEQRSNLLVSRYCFTQDGSAEVMYPSSPTRYLSSFGKKYGIEDCHPHKFRHSFASISIVNGADVKSISQILGHSDTSITLDIYCHSNREAQRKASEAFIEAITKEA